MTTLSPLALARQAALRVFAEHIHNMGAALLHDMDNPENNQEDSFDGPEWDFLKQLVARGALVTARLAYAVATAKAEE